MEARIADLEAELREAQAQVRSKTTCAKQIAISFIAVSAGKLLSCPSLLSYLQYTQAHATAINSEHAGQVSDILIEPYLGGGLSQ